MDNKLKLGILEATSRKIPAIPLKLPELTKEEKAVQEFYASKERNRAFIVSLLNKKGKK